MRSHDIIISKINETQTEVRFVDKQSTFHHYETIILYESVESLLDMLKNRSISTDPLGYLKATEA